MHWPTAVPLSTKTGHLQLPGERTVLAPATLSPSWGFNLIFWGARFFLPPAHSPFRGSGNPLGGVTSSKRTSWRNPEPYWVFIWYLSVRPRCF